jgi:hypothetical protein
MSQHVDGDEPEVIGMRAAISGVCLCVAANAMQRKDERLRRVTRLDAAGPDAAGVDVMLLEGDTPQISPDAGKVRWTCVTHN